MLQSYELSGELKEAIPIDYFIVLVRSPYLDCLVCKGTTQRALGCLSDIHNTRFNPNVLLVLITQ